MSVRVLVNEYPHRTVALSTESHTLLFKHTHTTSKEQGRNDSSTNLSLPNASRKSDTPRCMVEFAEKAAVNLKGFRTLTTAKGTLGLITLNSDVFICVVTGSSEVATLRPRETVQKIYAVEFFCLNRSDYDHGQAFEPNPYPGQTFASDERNHGGGYDQTDSTAEHPFSALKKLLGGGFFYYSLNFDLTRRLQDRSDANANVTVDIGSLDEGLLWNSYMIKPLLAFRSRLSSHERAALDSSGMLTSVIRGFAQTLSIPSSSSPIRSKVSNYPSTLTIVSRLSARRAGTRFNSRGVDDNGNVANFVETETIFWSPTGVCFSYVQIRGSIPIFWESSSSLIPGQQKIQITRSLEATQHSFDKHFEGLEKAYGAVHIVNLLSTEKPGEVELSSRYREHIARSPLKQQVADDVENHELLRSTEFDFHERTRQAGGYSGAQEIRPYIDPSAEGFVYFLGEDIEEDTVIDGVQQKTKRSVAVIQQNGVFRVNCLDCLDRTNLIQGIISQMALELFLDHRGERGNQVFWLRHSSLWADNGDVLSKIYAGTGALKSSFTRHGKMSLGGLMADARKSATRLYVNHFEDKDRQNTVDLLLGRLVGQGEVELFDPVHEWVMAETTKKRDEFESLETVKVWVGTYNLNGKMMSDINQLRTWLPDPSNGASDDFEVVVVGFQEIVELSPQQIMSTDPGRKAFWEDAVKQCLNAASSGDKKSRNSYVLLRSGQLVGAALMVFVKVSSLSRIRNVEGAIKKTGMSGMAGNKGAVAIRMDIEGTSVCFVTAHLAAGFGNYEERNRDYTTISSGLRFQRDRSIEDHEVVMWAGDFNYRVGLSYESARNLVSLAQKGISYTSRSHATRLTPDSEDALGSLYDNDQLNIQMVAGHVFQFYHEGRIRFLPTYKFDLGKDEYDSSEKARIPAWTDRILWRVTPGIGGHVRQQAYQSVMSVRFSDHKPVFGSFEIDVKKIDQNIKDQLVAKLYEKRLRDTRNRSNSDVLSGDDGEGFTSIGESDEDAAEDLMGYQSIQEGLPPASSDKRKWWLDGDRPVRSLLAPPREGMILNESRIGNPWREGEDDDWVEVEKPPGRNVSTAGRHTKPTGSAEKPVLPPPRRGRKVSGIDGTTSSSLEGSPAGAKELEMESMPTRNRPAPTPPSREQAGSIRNTSRMDRPSSVASTATTATMMTANSQNDRSDSGSVKKTPPPKPNKPAKLATLKSQEHVTQVPVHAVAPALPFPSINSSSVREKWSPNPIERNNNNSDSDERPPPLPIRTNTSSSIGSYVSSMTTNSPVATSPASNPSRNPSLRKALPPPPIQPRGVTRLQEHRPKDSSSNSIRSVSSSGSFTINNNNTTKNNNDIGNSSDEREVGGVSNNSSSSKPTLPPTLPPRNRKESSPPPLTSTKPIHQNPTPAPQTPAVKRDLLMDDDEDYNNDNNVWNEDKEDDDMYGSGSGGGKEMQPQNQRQKQRIDWEPLVPNR